MVCLGNICRSPLAEGILQNKVIKAGLNWQVDSAGTNHYQTGCPPHQFSLRVARLHNIDLCKQQCRQFTRQDMIDFDKIYVMDSMNYQDVKHISASAWDAKKVDLLLNELYPFENRNVPDPFGNGENAFHNIYQLIDEACTMVVKKYHPATAYRI